MSGSNQVVPTSYIGLDVLTGRQKEKRKASATPRESDIQFICPLHGKVKTGTMPRQKQKVEKGLLYHMQTLLGRSDLEQKLEAHGIKVKFNKSALRTVQSISKESDLLSREELSLLTVEKLKELINSFEKEIGCLNSEMMNLQEEKQLMATENASLKQESKDLEERVKMMLRPWINRYPHSDDFTRAYLIN